MNLITLTLNPAIDVHCQSDTFLPFHENLAEITSRDLGGKGINISRALCANGVLNTAVILVGRDNDTEFQKGLKAQLSQTKYFAAEGSVRENITLHSKEGETRISFRGFTAPSGILKQVQNYLSSFDFPDTIVTFTGSIPKGIEKEAVISFLQELKEKGAKLVIDSKSITLEELLLLKPWLIKPNEEEIKAYAGAVKALDCGKMMNWSEKESGEGDMDLSFCVYAAKQLHQAGVEQVMISLGSKGALLCNGALYYAQPPQIEAKSTIGAGDSTIAGFLAAYAENNSASAETLLRSAVAYGTAACLTEGTQPPMPEEVERLYKEIRLEEKQRNF